MNHPQWLAFCRGLRTRGGDCVPSAFEHPSARYRRLGPRLGSGCYGTVYAFVAESSDGHPLPEGVPPSFALKVINEDCVAELAAVAALQHAPPEAQLGVTPAVAVRVSGLRAQLCMPLFDGSLQEWLGPSPVAARDALRIMRRISRSVEALWNAGLAYCDLKKPNVLVRDGERVMVLGDLGSICIGGRDALFTYPPHRAVALSQEAAVDGFVSDLCEADIAWSLASLLLCLLKGDRWADMFLSTRGLRSRGLKLGRMDFAIERVADEVASVARSLRQRGDLEAAAGVMVGLRAWRDCNGSIRGFCDSIRRTRASSAPAVLYRDSLLPLKRLPPPVDLMPTVALSDSVVSSSEESSASAS